MTLGLGKPDPGAGPILLGSDLGSKINVGGRGKLFFSEFLANGAQNDPKMLNPVSGYRSECKLLLYAPNRWFVNRS